MRDGVHSMENSKYLKKIKGKLSNRYAKYDWNDGDCDVECQWSCGDVYGDVDVQYTYFFPLIISFEI